MKEEKMPSLETKHLRFSLKTFCVAIDMMTMNFYLLCLYGIEKWVKCQLLKFLQSGDFKVKTALIKRLFISKHFRIRKHTSESKVCQYNGHKWLILYTRYMHIFYHIFSQVLHTSISCVIFAFLIQKFLGLRASILCIYFYNDISSFIYYFRKKKDIKIVPDFTSFNKNLETLTQAIFRILLLCLKTVFVKELRTRIYNLLELILVLIFNF